MTKSYISMLLNGFQSTRPVWGATVNTDSVQEEKGFQSTRPVWGATSQPSTILCAYSDFNPRAPCGARPAWRLPQKRQQKFQSTRPVWGATSEASGNIDGQIISIHAPRVGRDLVDRGDKGRAVISIHAPRVGRDFRKAPWREPRTYFNPRAPCGARRSINIKFSPMEGISIHAPRVGRDPDGELVEKSTGRFQSTRPVWGATASYQSPESA